MLDGCLMPFAPVCMLQLEANLWTFFVVDFLF
jgi:hypothetical protein